jgi:hypothetical protein
MIEREAGDGVVRVTFSLPESEGVVSVLGSFNDWDPTAHPLRGDGPWQSVTVEFAPGSRHEFRYLASDGRWFDDPDADGWGGENGILLIDGGGSIAAAGESDGAAADATPAPAKRTRRRTTKDADGSIE